MAHRAKPTASKILSAMWHVNDNERHVNRINSVKGRVDNKQPRVYNHLVSRQKKEIMLEEKYTRIERENRLLLKKMDYIWRHSVIDNKNEAFKGPRSLNAVRRKKKLQKIMLENQSILKRIQRRKGTLDRNKWKEHSKNHSLYLKNMESQTLWALIKKAEDKKYGKNGNGKLKPVRKKKAKVSKGGQVIDGQNVIVTVDEIREPHAFHFRTYNLDTTEQSDVKVEFSLIPTLIKGGKAGKRLLASAQRGELAKLLLKRLHFEGKQLTLDQTAYADDQEAAGEEASSAAEGDANADGDADAEAKADADADADAPAPTEKKKRKKKPTSKTPAKKRRPKKKAKAPTSPKPKTSSPKSKATKAEVDKQEAEKQEAEKKQQQKAAADKAQEEKVAADKAQAAEAEQKQKQQEQDEKAAADKAAADKAAADKAAADKAAADQKQADDEAAETKRAADAQKKADAEAEAEVKRQADADAAAAAQKQKEEEEAAAAAAAEQKAQDDAAAAAAAAEAEAEVAEEPAAIAAEPAAPTAQGEPVAEDEDEEDSYGSADFDA